MLRHYLENIKLLFQYKIAGKYKFKSCRFIFDIIIVFKTKALICLLVICWMNVIWDLF